MPPIGVKLSWLESTEPVLVPVVVAVADGSEERLCVLALQVFEQGVLVGAAVEAAHDIDAQEGIGFAPLPLLHLHHAGDP